MKKKCTFNLGIVLALCALTGCASLDEINARREAKQKEEAQRKAEIKRKREEMRRAAAEKRRKREAKVKIRLDGENAYAWYDRVEKFYQDEYDKDDDRKRRFGTRDSIAAAKKRYDEKMRLFGETFVAELKREAHRKPEENLAQWKERVEKFLPESYAPYNYKNRVRWQKRERLVSTAKEVFKEEFSKGKTAERKQHAEALLLQTEKELNDPAFKYPYFNRIAGVELCDGYLSGLSCKWIAVLRFLPDIKRCAQGNSGYKDTARDLNNAKGKVYGFDSYKGMDFYFDKQYGTLHSMSFKIKGGHDAVSQKISEYKKKYPGLRHTRKTQRDGKNCNEFPVSFKIVWDIHTDTLESDRMKIVITSTAFCQLKNFYILSDELSDLQKQEMKEKCIKEVRNVVENSAAVTITDKVMKEYFEKTENRPQKR